MMKKMLLFIIVMILITSCTNNIKKEKSIISETEIKLPKPSYDSTTSIEEAILNRRSIRDYSDKALDLKQISQLLWSAQGLTSEWGGRTAPSAGAIYPLELYLVVGNVNNLETGLYHYIPEKHSLEKLNNNDLRNQLANAALNQAWVANAPSSIIFTANYQKTAKRYGDRATRYVDMETGHAAENVYLQAVSLNVSTVVVGAFNENKVKSLLNLPEELTPLYIMPVGNVK